VKALVTSLATHAVLLFGILGTLLCLVGIAGVWYVESRIARAGEQAVDWMDHSFSALDGRLTQVQELAAESKITIDEVQQRLSEWTATEARERLADELELETRLQKLSAGLHRAEQMVEWSQETVEDVQQALAIGVGLGLPWEADSVAPLSESITELEEHLSHAIETTESLRQFSGADGNDESIASRIERLATITARLAATFVTIDSRLDAFRGRLVDAEHAVHELNAKLRTRVILVAIGVTLLLLWMAAGQVCLARIGCRRSRWNAA
jgi:chromosome segregation ATPase